MSRQDRHLRHFLVVGGQRCGTTWLHDQLAAHPQIAMARPARPEPKVFLHPGPHDAPSYREQYFAHATDERALGEKSTSYLEAPGAPDRVATTLGAPRIVVQLRDPVARAVSNYRFSRAHGVEDRSLNEALRADLVSPREWDPAKTSVSPFAYVSRGRYAEQLRRWTQRFEVHVQFLEEVRSEPDRIGLLYRWLGVDEGFRHDAGGELVNASAPTDDRLDPGLEADLREHYADSDTALAALLARPLPWPHRRSP
ncbi:MAG TPA: sulfotransferase domain-containing protein [Ornithinimicrobium sp.]|uniref:sulfotransferase domain-containing protein n=1 Tax=Ornithinimicrobium sp. TaxID=1977084 RepID=UPI002B48FDE9|nr:sulfotransferase domain-containing protein [Ornithinimicrobium sp.]HKJ10791.1 sulfotransferase domain-containing protein [Ornithinimicrobium sp.]